MRCILPHKIKSPFSCVGFFFFPLSQPTKVMTTTQFHVHVHVHGCVVQLQKLHKKMHYERRSRPATTRVLLLPTCCLLHRWQRMRMTTTARVRSCFEFLIISSTLANHTGRDIIYKLKKKYRYDRIFFLLLKK